MAFSIEDGHRRALQLLSALGIFIAQGPTHPVNAEPPAPRFELPVACEIGRDCMVQNHFDHDSGPAARDYACGSLVYDGHDGTDIRVPDLPTMARGVAVLAAAPGRVRATRDAMRDVDVREIGRAAVKDREAGNGVLIDHGGDWESQYGHLRRGSITVKPGDQVTAGQMLGMIGMSGLAEFPHVHFEIRYRKKPVDPFVGLKEHEGCGPGKAPLWSQAALGALAYRPGGLLRAGFAAEAPDTTIARRGDYRADHLPGNSAALVFWVDLYGARGGDLEQARLTGPDGAVIAEKAKRLDQDKAQWFSFLGRKRRGAAWPAGTYRATYQLLRRVDGEDRKVVEVTREIEVR